VPTTFRGNGRQRHRLHQALALKQVDVLGFSIGGFVAQEITLQAAELVRRLVLVGTGPRGGQNMATLTPEAQQIFGATHKVPEEIWLKVHFTDSEASQAAGREFLKRFLRRTVNRDPEVNEKVAPAQIEAIGKWGVQRQGSYEYLKTILQPTLVINGDNDVIIYSINSWILPIVSQRYSNKFIWLWASGESRSVTARERS
jgi:pimeloyl-ACP methyl ester carboxylesterase